MTDPDTPDLPASPAEEADGSAKHESVTLALEIEDRYRKWLEGKRRAYTSPHNYASEMGHPCARYLVYKRISGDRFELPDVGLQSIFDQGSHVEKATVAELGELGYEWVWGQRPFKDEARQISGRIDGGISKTHRSVLPGEIKSMQGTAWQAIRPGLGGLRDVLNHRSWFIRKYPVQIGLYLYMSNEPEGILVLRDKWYWRLRITPVPFDMVRGVVEEALTKADVVNAHVKAGTLPDRIDYDRDICGRCAARMICLPGMTGAGAGFLDDVELVEMLMEYDKLSDYARRHEALKDELKDELNRRMEALGVREAVIGNRFVATLKTIRRKRMQATGEEYDSTSLTMKPLEVPLVSGTNNERK